jgi:ATP/maltotriose-dependent transcriptional regulator MalT
MRSDEQAAYDLLQHAVARPIDQRDRSDLEWHQFILACELELPEAPDLLCDYSRSAAESFDEHVRFLNGKGVLASQFGGIGEVLLQPREIMDLARHTSEPVIRCGFMNRYALLLWAQAQYAAALGVLECELDALKAARLDFAIPHALALRAAIEVGLRRYRTAESTIRRVLSLQPTDAYIRLEITCTRARALCAQGRAADAAAITTASFSEPPNRAVYGEYVATRALALATTGAKQAATDAAVEARQITRTHETHVRADFADAVVASLNDDEAPLRRATAAAWKTGQIEPVVSTYRAYPRVLAILSPEDPHYVDARNLIHRLGDERCARAGGLKMDDIRFGRLTKRENEVLDLLADGLSNKEIAIHLYITEVTAKLHVSRILGKLGVTSRTEAALRAVEQRRYDADAATGESSAI